MLKNKRLIIAIAMLVVIILSLTLPTVRADDEEATAREAEAVVTSENADEEQKENVQSEYKQEDLYLCGTDVTIDYIVDGNIFVIANNVTINSQIGGDAFICANNITVEQNGYIFSNLFAVSQNLNIKGIVYDLYSASKNVEISGYVYRDIRVATNSLNVFGTIGRNALVDCDKINFVQSNPDENGENTVSIQGSINGNLTYSTKEEANIPEGAVAGQVEYQKNLQSKNVGNTILDSLISLATAVVTTLIIWLLISWLSPKFIEKSKTLVMTRTLPVIGLGILTPIASIVASVILLIVGITSGLGFLLITAFILLAGLSTSISIITLSKIICDKFNIEKKLQSIAVLVATTIILWLIALIPYIGALINIIIVVIGLGLLVGNIFLNENKVKKDN